ncbi:hypothetical protein NDU88_007971 [Pleurodeles waltl]|uniref:Uncharacterized protein n=1 Tax=Pleurodeles waltl TaxID=8319 RepID=A0AAV7NWG0_PLEWA|nr:hypothetical protein NDU88_007971 [Pleurodeles waltl]
MTSRRLLAPMRIVPAVSEDGEAQAAGGKVAPSFLCALHPPQLSAVGLRPAVVGLGLKETLRPAGSRWGMSPHPLGPWMGRSTGLKCFFVCFFPHAGAKARTTGCRPSLVARENVVSQACAARKTRQTDML